MHKSYKTALAIVVVISLLFSICIPVSAVNPIGFGYTFYMPISKPPANDVNGYVEVFVHYPELGKYGCFTYLVFNDFRLDHVSENYVTLSLQSNRKITFTPFPNDGSTFTSVWCIDDGGNVYNTGSLSGVAGSISDTFSGNIIGLHVYGNVTCSQLSTYNIESFTCVYGDDSYSTEMLIQILAAIKSQSNHDIIANADKNADEIQSNADKNADKIQSNVDKNASDIQSNQDENTDKQIEADKDLYEQEKQEITDSGNQAADAADSVPNESEGFISALGTFVDTMKTTDTSCSINFPAIKIPSIAGFPGATLTEEKEVNFEEAIGLIPEQIMKLVQAITTIALIVFCFKELYDTISEALTRKKADSDG